MSKNFVSSIFKVLTSVSGSFPNRMIENIKDRVRHCHENKYKEGDVLLGRVGRDDGRGLGTVEGPNEDTEFKVEKTVKGGNSASDPITEKKET